MLILFFWAAFPAVRSKSSPRGFGGGASFAGIVLLCVKPITKQLHPRGCGLSTSIRAADHTCNKTMPHHAVI